MKKDMNIKKDINLVNRKLDSEQKFTDRLAGADGLRAIACLAVITHHISQQLMMNAQPIWIQKLQSFALMGNSGVSIFFILSGFLLSYPFWKSYLNNETYPNFKKYLLRRAARIMPGFYFALIVSSLFVILNNIPVEYFWIRLLAALTFTSGFNYITFFPSDVNGPLWSISFEVFCYFLMPMFMYILFKFSRIERSFSKSLKYWICILVIIIFINQFVHILFIPDNINRGWQYGIIGGAKAWMPNYNPVGFFGHFSFGIIAAGITVALYKNYEKSLELKRRNMFDIVGLTALIGSLILLWFMKDKPEFGYSLQNQPYFFPFYQLLVATALAVFPHTNFIGRILDNGFFRYTAKVSFGLYLWHHLYIYVVSNLVVNEYRFMGIANIKDWSIISIAIIITSYITATLSYKFIEMPIINLVHKNKSKIANKSNNIKV